MAASDSAVGRDFSTPPASKAYPEGEVLQGTRGSGAHSSVTGKGEAVPIYAPAKYKHDCVHGLCQCVIKVASGPARWPTPFFNPALRRQTRWVGRQDQPGL